MRIDIVPISLRKQFINTFEKDKCFIELCEDRFIYSMVFHAEEPKDQEDKSLGLEATDTNLLITVIKDRISGIELGIAAKGKRWQTTIFVSGFPNDINLFHAKYEDAKVVHDEILNWLFKK